MSLSAAIGRQLRCPSGPAGSAAGHIMRIVNLQPNALAVAALQLLPGDTVLELGCGPGQALEMMVPRVSQGIIYAVDPSPVMLAQAHRRNRTAIRSGRVRLYRAKTEQLPFADASMNKVLAVNVAYFWRETEAALREIRRVLRRDGLISIYVTDASAMRRWPFAGPDTHRLFGSDGLARHFRRAGFRDADFTIAEITVTPRITGLVATLTMNPLEDCPPDDRRYPRTFARRMVGLAPASAACRRP